MKKHPSPLKAIRNHCLDCSDNSAHEVKLCLVEQCNLYPFRFGKNPNRAGLGGDISKAREKLKNTG
jgi:hypothetical protein